jgi:teichuronic acid exporter
MSDTLRKKTINGLFWAFLDIIGMQGIMFIILLVLARILQPSEFGLIAMLTIFIAVAQSILDSGYSAALIQKKNANHKDESSIFYFNILMGFITTGLLYFSAKWIASFYNEPALISLTHVMSFTILIDSFGIIHYSIMKRSFSFKKLTMISIIASFLSGIIGISMAYKGLGVWSLVWFTLFNKLFRLCLYWIFNSWRPGLEFSFKSLRSMFVYGSNLLFVGLLETIFNNLYFLVIGKLFSPADLGYYSRAKSLQQIPVQNISGIVNRVTFPVFSKIQDDSKRMKRGLKKGVSTMALITFPMMIGLAVVAKPLVIVLLTTKWLPSVLFLQLLCGVGLTYPLSTINLNVLKAQGRSSLFFKLEFLKKAVIVIAIIVTYPFGIEAMICGQIVVHTVSYLWNSYFVGKSIDYSLVEQLKDIIPTLIIACLMGIGIYVIDYADINNQLLLLIIQLIIGIALYIILCYTFKLSSFIELFEIVKIKLIKTVSKNDC